MSDMWQPHDIHVDIGWTSFSRASARTAVLVPAAAEPGVSAVAGACAGAVGQGRSGDAACSCPLRGKKALKRLYSMGLIEDDSL